jgi:selenide,water dikinase
MAGRLTSQVKGGGCASKLSPSLLAQVLQYVPRVTNGNVLVGYDTADDAGVYRLSADCALVQTTDFFTPMVDDPYTFGAIAAANALSDVYAMGGRPISALSLVAFPPKDDLDTLRQILHGGADKIREAECVILGGHSVGVGEILFGYAVTGLIHPDRVWTNAGARPGDTLLLTKRLGTGVISTALKRGAASEADVAAATESMLTLNRRACEALLDFDVHAVTDVTGFGLMGHGREMAVAGNVTLEIEAARLRWLSGAVDYARAGIFPGGLANNRGYAECMVDSSAARLEPAIDSLLYDPQTSGGLLVSLPEGDAAEVERRYPEAYRIGRVLERGAKPIRIV